MFAIITNKNICSGVIILIKDNERLIFHIDVNSAYLSWTAVKLLQYGGKLDIREVPSVIGGNEENRHGIILAASIPAKKLGIKTGESIFEAKQKCNNLLIYPPDYNWYVKSSNAMVEILNEYSPKIQRYSIDECFMDCTHFKKNYKKISMLIKMRISNELGFNCNIGISTNKLLAKMASDFKTKNTIHTLFKEEIKSKMWPLPVSDLFMVGKATQKKLNNLNIYTIGDLAAFDIKILTEKLHSHGKLIHDYANGIDNSFIRKSNYLEIKGIGNSTTLPYDVESKEEALKILLSLTETCAIRLRENKSLCSLASVSITNNNFIHYSHQKSFYHPTDCTNELYKYIKKAFNEMYTGDSIRHLGIRLTNLCSNEYHQSTLFDFEEIEKQKNLDRAIDKIRNKFGRDSIIRSTFIHSGIKPLSRGSGNEEYYPIMSSIL